MLYQKKYYQLLWKKLLLLTEKKYFEKHKMLQLFSLQPFDFIVSADQSSIINYLYLEYIEHKTQGLWNPETYLQKLQHQIDLFLSGKYQDLVMNMWEAIAPNLPLLTLHDNNPYAQFDAHPDHKKTGWVQGWGEKSFQEWKNVFFSTFELLKKVDEGIYEELSQSIKKIIPLWTAYEVHNSASYKECIGHLYIGFTIDSFLSEANILEALIHESSHNKLNILMQFDSLLLNDGKEIYYSAIRPDARPMRGVFLGYHAFAPTMYILMKAYKEGLLWENDFWLPKLTLYYLKTKMLQKVIHKYARFTPLWQEVSSEIDAVIVWMDQIVKELGISKDLVRDAKTLQEEHFFQVNKKYPLLQY